MLDRIQHSFGSVVLNAVSRYMPPEEQPMSVRVATWASTVKRRRAGAIDWFGQHVRHIPSHYRDEHVTCDLVPPPMDQFGGTFDAQPPPPSGLRFRR